MQRTDQFFDVCFFFFVLFVIASGFLIMSLNRRFKRDDHHKDEMFDLFATLKAKNIISITRWAQQFVPWTTTIAINLCIIFSRTSEKIFLYCLFVDFIFQLYNAAIDFTRLSAIAACKWALIINDFWWEIMISCWTQKSTGSAVKI